MTFSRSASGQENQSRFFNVNAVVYVEGDTTSHDQLFWEEVFAAYGTHLKVKILPRGGKDTLLALASDILSKNIANVVVAMDSDYDRLFDIALNDPRIVYTHGYSWENDLWNPERAREIIWSFCPLTRGSDDPIAELNDALEAFGRQMHWCIVADIVCVSAGIGLIPRDKSAQVLAAWDSSKKPAVNRHRVRVLLRKAQQRRTGKLRLRRRGKVVPLRDCVGHLLEEFYFRLVSHFVFKHTKMKLPKDAVRALAMNKFSTFMGKCPEVDQHFKAQFKRLAANSMA